MSKPKKTYKVYYPSCKPFTVYNCSSPQNACRQAFSHWIKSGQMKRQPRTTDDGGFEHTTLEIL